MHCPQRIGAVACEPHERILPMIRLVIVGFKILSLDKFKIINVLSTIVKSSPTLLPQ